MSLQAAFGPAVIRSGQVLSLAEAQQPLSVQWTPVPGHLYTVLVWDLDAPSGPFLHYLAVNSLGPGRGEVLAAYTPPAPPSGSHRYFVQLYDQSRQIDLEPVTRRQNFPVQQLIQGYGLQLLAELQFVVLATTLPMLGLSLSASPATGVLPLVGAGSPRGETSPPRLYSPRRSGKDYFRADTLLSPEEQSYCRCLVHVQEREPAACPTGTYGCPNAYAVCHRHIKVGNPDCSGNYNFQNFSDAELAGFVAQHKVPFSGPNTRQGYLQAIQQKGL